MSASDLLRNAIELVNRGLISMSEGRRLISRATQGLVPEDDSAPIRDSRDQYFNTTNYSGFPTVPESEDVTAQPWTREDLESVGFGVATATNQAPMRLECLLNYNEIEALSRRTNDDSELVTFLRRRGFPVRLGYDLTGNQGVQTENGSFSWIDHNGRRTYIWEGSRPLSQQEQVAEGILASNPAVPRQTNRTSVVPISSVWPTFSSSRLMTSSYYPMTSGNFTVTVPNNVTANGAYVFNYDTEAHQVSQELQATRKKIEKAIKNYDEEPKRKITFED